MCDIRRYRTVMSHCKQSDLPPPSMSNRYISCALLRTLSVHLSAKLYLQCAQCMFKQDLQLYLKVCTLTTEIERSCACCCSSATTMDQWSISWSSSSTSHAHSLLNIHLELELRPESLEKESHSKMRRETCHSVARTMYDRTTNQTK